MIASLFPLVPSLSVCSTPSLRFLNALLLALLPLAYARLLPLLRHPVLRASTHGKRTPSSAKRDAIERADEQWEALAVALFPVAAFFAFLYYTDLASVILVLASHALALKKHWAPSAIVRLCLAC